MKPHVLACRLDNAGDILLAGPAIRAIAAKARRVTLLAGPRGAEAAALLPGVTEVRTWSAPWIEADPPGVDPADVDAAIRTVRSLGVDQAIVFTSFHQSPLPLALMLRLAGTPVIAAISEDYAGSLLDIRHHVPEDTHEVERALSLVRTLGFDQPPGDDGRLRIQRRWRGILPIPSGEYVVLHPGASVPARAWAAENNAGAVRSLVRAGYQVVVTGNHSERALAHMVAGNHRHVTDLSGKLTFAGLAEVLASAVAVVAGNTGPAHLAAAVGTPVVSLFAPTVPAVRWRPWRVPHVLLGRQTIGCAGCRARQCPIPGQPCLADVTGDDVVNAVDQLAQQASDHGHRERIAH